MNWKKILSFIMSVLPLIIDLLDDDNEKKSEVKK